MSATLALAQLLIERASITPDDAGCQQLLAKHLAKIGFTIHHMPYHTVNNLWATRGNGAPFFCFAGHTDVVPAGNLAAWQSPPFTPTLHNDYLYGRGSADMKSSLAAMIVACEQFIDQYPNHPGTCALLITSDEEGKAEHGTQAVLKTLAQRQQIPQWCLVGEASSSKHLADTIKIGRRGTLSGTLSLFGKQGHVAYPHLADNPIHRALGALKEISEYPWEESLAPFSTTSLQFSHIHAGTGANNVIPGLLQADFNVRFAAPLSVKKIQETIHAILNKHQCVYQLNWHLGGQPFYTSPESPFVKKISHTIEKTLGYAPIHSTSGGTSDGRFFAQYGCEVVELGPVNATIHQANECIDIHHLEQLTLLYQQILKTVFIS